MEKLMREATLLVARIHDILLRVDDKFALSFSDKDMHFIVMFAVGMALFFVVHFVFKRLAKISVTAISFIYVFTVMTVLGFAIEVGQRITGTGNMDFRDIAAGCTACSRSSRPIRSIACWRCCLKRCGNGRLIRSKTPS